MFILLKVVAAVLQELRNDFAPELKTAKTINPEQAFQKLEKAKSVILFNDTIMRTYEYGLYDAYEAILKDVLEEENLTDPVQIKEFVAQLKIAFKNDNMSVFDHREYPTPQDIIQELVEIRSRLYAYQVVRQDKRESAVNRQLMTALNETLPKKSPELFLDDDFGSLYLDSIKKYMKKINEYTRELYKKLMQED